MLDLQTDLIDAGTRVVAPLVPAGEGPRPLTRLEPVLSVEGVDHVLRTGEMAAIPAALLPREPVADLRAEEYRLRNALGMVFSGF